MLQVVVFGVLFFLNFVVLSWLLEFVLTFLIWLPFRILYSLLRLLGVKRAFCTSALTPGFCCRIVNTR